MFAALDDSGKVLPGLEDKISDISYSSGIKCGSPDKLKYFDSIFEDKERS